ncbi:MAG: sigma-70 family RNA polymerase sigma factor [Dokdonella sp.]|uniref:ECF-type sigma factor n=1 Tax=Dokdonella sp. TaxID=2291710 RepID=UPI0025C0EFBA|nr:ECF-type sigma factor [Dokdonella sp.]MBX3701363.1 sigma-70 family RNA polymerase sigma factor [Dokdonella sp.]MCW5577803.1 sigma-70 family RNA polymerase sigma factor [Dokdonella sp.]
MTDEAMRTDAAKLAPLLLENMRVYARRERRRLRAGETLRTTALVHEAYLRLLGSAEWASELHFLRAAALAMRQVLVDHARRTLTAKHGGGHIVSLDDQLFDPYWQSDERMVELDEALSRLDALNPRLTDIVECRFFAGYSEEETARVLGISDRTVRRDWIKAKAWLYRELGEAPEPPATP